MPPIHQLANKLRSYKSLVPWAAISYWLLLQIALYTKFGVRIVMDSERYLSLARDLHQYGLQAEAGHNLWYGSYAIFIAGVQSLAGDNPLWVVIAQTLLSGVALIALWRLTFLLYDCRRCAWTALILALLWARLWQWNFYILTESLSISLLLLALWAMAETVRKPQYALAALPLLLLACFSRPNLMPLIGVPWAAILFSLWQSRSSRFPYALGASIILVIGGVLLANRMLQTFELIGRYRLGEVIFVYEGWLLEVPSDLYIPSLDAGGPVYRLWLFFWHNPLYMLKLMSAKVGAYLLHIKPYNTLWHNVLTLLFLGGLYAACLHTLRKLRPFPPLLAGMLAYVLANIGIIALTVEDYDGRFLFGVLPVLMVLGAYLRQRHVLIRPVVTTKQLDTNNV